MTNIATTRAGFQSEGTFTPDNLIAGDFPIRTKKVILVSGQNLARGALLGTITTGGKRTLCLTGVSDGSQTPREILAEDVDASAGDKEATVYISGDFNQDRIIYGASHSAATVSDFLRDLNIYLHKAVLA